MNSTTSAVAFTSTTPTSTTSIFFSSTSTNSPSTFIETVSTSTSTNAVSSSSQQASTSQAAVTSTSEQTSTETPTEQSTTAVFTSVITASASSDGSSSVGPKTIILTSTESSLSFPSVTSSTPATSSSQSSSTSSNAAALSTSSVSSQKSTGGLSAGGKIAVAVVVPVAAVALIVLGLLFFWRRRKQRKDAEELRRKEVEEYGFNPNNDPTLPAIGSSSPEDEPSEMRETDGAGYRGWGTTSSAARKASTTLSSGNGPIGMAISDNGSNPENYHGGSPTAATTRSSEVQSGDPLVGSPTNGRPTTADSETIGALGAAPVASSNRQDRDINRGPSNASSAYSAGQRSDGSGEAGVPSSAPGPQYYNEAMLGDEGNPQQGPYGEGNYGSGQPVIRDVQARRNTRIEKPSVFPQQGNAGISQNF